ncbi:Uncharacterised protein [Mycobacteroides abscessus subsp. massiliense]|nr:hypothetical protein DDJ98_08355 [Mycobacteroides abscessus]TKV38854.1 hypothetical protein CFA71_18150 [Mycobacteroides abscessus subsp. bolletii]SHY74809.1 Uncharacterised protein [Mycobacteroides abscessus subsp. abscessus]SKK73513.1 Uncharacterised protein [Mycobacteroides abscessus subsp. massiliense]PVA58955.1 hypothetical protein DDJ72_09155 [Mycobacteroides abscessus]
MAGVAGSAGGFVTGIVRGVLIAVMLVAAVLGVCIVAARHERTEYAKKHDLSTAARVDERWQLIIRDRIGALLLQVVKVVNTEDPAERRNLASSARSAILALASADAIGIRVGVRMNLFRLSPDRAQMTPVELGSMGRSGESSRVFTMDDETMVATLNGQSRFIENTRKELGADEAKQLSYETFATSPVGSANGTIWGVLTVDAPKTGDLDKARDMALMNVFAGLIAVTYACECYAKPRR